MSGVNLSLDQIIAANKKTKSFRSDGLRKRGGGRGGRTTAKAAPRRSSQTRGSTAGSGKVPAGKWKHDKFNELESGFSSGGGSVPGAGNPNKKVLVNVSNLGPGVSSADLEELFAQYNGESITAHFNEHAEPLGTGSVTLRRQDAIKMIKDFDGVCLDGLPIKLKIMEDAAGGIQNRLSKTVVSRVQRTSAIERTRGGRVQKRGGGRTSKGEGSRFLDRLADEDEEKPRGGGGRRGGRGGRTAGGREKKTEKTAEQLDAELEQYMAKKL